VGDADGDVRAGVFDACGPQALTRARTSSAETPDALFTAGPYRRVSTVILNIEGFVACQPVHSVLPNQMPWPSLTGA
jgi:hypothetical protein